MMTHSIRSRLIAVFIGAGGMGEVYRAVDTRLNRTYMLRMLRPWRICAGSVKACRGPPNRHYEG